MKFTILKAALAACIAFSATSCMTTYDAEGNPVQSVDPAAAAAGVVAAGLIGAAIADDNDRDVYYYRRPYHRPPYHRPPHYRPRHR